MMQKHYRAFPLDAQDTEMGNGFEIDANGDLDAFEKARQQLGHDAIFVLWEGKRQVLTYRPLGIDADDAPSLTAPSSRQ